MMVWVLRQKRRRRKKGEKEKKGAYSVANPAGNGVIKETDPTCKHAG